MSETLSSHKIDSTKLSSFATCRRKYLYEHVFGWQPETKNLHLVFGEAWHRAMAVLFAEGYSDKSLAKAFQEFEEFFRQNLTEDQIEIENIKTPERALEALVKYVERWKTEDRDLQTLHVEVSGSVPVSDRKLLFFRIDTIVRHPDGRVSVIDHKTANSIRYRWKDQFYLSFQTGCYLHVLFSTFDFHEVKSIIYNGVGFKPVTFERVEIPCAMEAQLNWLVTVNRLLDDLDHELELLSLASAEDKVLQAFPLNPTACSHYFGCQWHDFCLAWPNPLRRAQTPPPGYIVRFWDPEEKEAKEKWSL